MSSISNRLFFFVSALLLISSLVAGDPGLWTTTRIYSASNCSSSSLLVITANYDPDAGASCSSAVTACTDIASLPNGNDGWTSENAVAYAVECVSEAPTVPQWGYSGVFTHSEESCGQAASAVIVKNRECLENGWKYDCDETLSFGLLAGYSNESCPAIGPGIFPTRMCLAAEMCVQEICMSEFTYLECTMTDVAVISSSSIAGGILILASALMCLCGMITVAIPFIVIIIVMKAKGGKKGKNQVGVIQSHPSQHQVQQMPMQQMPMQMQMTPQPMFMQAQQNQMAPRVVLVSSNGY